MAKSRWVHVALGVALSVALLAAKSDAGGRYVREYTLFAGSNTDSTEQASPWIPVFGASRIYIRTWSGKAAFHASTDADSTFSDSLVTFKVVFTDSTPVNYKAAAETLLFDPAVATVDTINTGGVVIPRPNINRQLRGPGNGAGIITGIYPSVPTSTTLDNAGFIMKRYMRIRVTPLRRLTAGTGSAVSGGNRVNGLRKFRMWAYVIYDNQP